MTDIHEVIIVGAGVSGLMLAKLLDGSGLRVLLLEKKSEIRVEPNTFGTFTATAREHGFEDYIVKYFHTWAFYGPTVKAAQTSEKIMCLVDCDRWARSLDFQRVRVKTGVDLQSARRTEGGIVLMDGTDGYQGRLVVDASGHAQIVHALLGLTTRQKSGLSYEVELEGCEIPVNNEASFIMDFRVSNSGGWIYALSKDKAQFGWADFWPESAAGLSDLKARVLAAMTRVGPQRDWFRKARVTYAYGRFGPSGSVSRDVHANLISIGDAGGFGTPATLEGFRQALDSAKLAYLTIVEAKSFSRAELEPYLARFHALHGRYYRMHEIVRFVYLHWMRNEDIDRWLKNFARVGRDDFFRLIKGELTVSLTLKTLDPTLVKDIGLNALNRILPGFARFRDQLTPSKKETSDALR